MDRLQKTANIAADQQNTFNRLPVAERLAAAERKYSAAVAMYAATELSLRAVAEECGVTAAGLSAHIGKYHRNLLLARYGIDPSDPIAATLKVKPPKGQSLITHLKYKEAIEACGDIAYIEYNVTQVARMFNLDGSALASQLRVHYPDVIPHRERVRHQLGVADNIHRGVRPESVLRYEEALRVYAENDMTISAVAEKCNVSKGGFIQFLRFYHPNVIKCKATRRAKAAGNDSFDRNGHLSGNGRAYGPKAETVAQYAPALEMYRNTSLTIKEIAAVTGVPAEGFRAYIRQWHRGERLERRGYKWDGCTEPVLEGSRHFLKSTRGKYALAIASLRENPRQVTKVAEEFGLNADVFRSYLKTHAPELAAEQGMVRLSDGNIVKRSSFEKYAPAVQEYATSAASLKEIAGRHGLVYQSLLGYVLRNCRCERELHKKIVESVNSNNIKE